MYTPAVLNNGKDYDASPNPRLGKSGYGLGWSILRDTSHGKIVSHGGSYPGIMSNFSRNLTRKQVIILYDNTAWTGIFFLDKMVSDLLNDIPITSILAKKSLAKVYGQTMMDSGSAVAIVRFITGRNDTLHYQILEREFNTLGYQFFLDGLSDKAERVFELNVFLFPHSYNAYDSYADALVKNGKIQLAKAMYRQAITLNPTYPDARNKLSQLE
jgi:tetratricopeptide (TPR) repeat protein